MLPSEDELFIDLKLIADQLKAARKEAGLSQEEVAKRSGLSQSTVSNLERAGDKSCNFGSVLAYARAVNKVIYVGRQ